MSGATNDQIKAIHTLARRAGMDEDTRRAFMERETGVRSSKDMSVVQAASVIDKLKVVAGDRHDTPRKPLTKGALRLDGPFVGPARALWISGYHLGVVHDRTDKALNAFAARQTSVDSLNWVKSPKDGSRLIEALKGWLAREAGVDWTAHGQDARGRKTAVYLAIRRMLTAAGIDVQFVDYPGRIGVRSLAEEKIDELVAAAGQELRRARTGKR